MQKQEYLNTFLELQTKLETLAQPKRNFSLNYYAQVISEAYDQVRNCINYAQYIDHYHNIKRNQYQYFNTLVQTLAHSSLLKFKPQTSAEKLIDYHINLQKIIPAIQAINRIYHPKPHQNN